MGLCNPQPTSHHSLFGCCFKRVCITISLHTRSFLAFIFLHQLSSLPAANQQSAIETAISRFLPLIHCISVSYTQQEEAQQQQSSKTATTRRPAAASAPPHSRMATAQQRSLGTAAKTTSTPAQQQRSLATTAKGSYLHFLWGVSFGVVCVCATPLAAFFALLLGLCKGTHDSVRRWWLCPRAHATRSL